MDPVRVPAPGVGHGTVLATGAVVLVAFVVTPAVVLGVAVLAFSGGLLPPLGWCQRGSSPSGPGGAVGGLAQVGDAEWNGEQLTNTQTITGVVQQRKLPKRAAVLAISTAIVESRLENVHYGDRDSLGLFQQRPSMGWGSPEEVTNPVYATGKFLDHLVELDGWHEMPPGVAQQKVQASAFPDRYAPQEQPAEALTARFWNGPDNPLPAPSSGDSAQHASTGPTAGCPDQGASSSNIALDPAKIPPGFQLPADPQQRAAVEFALSKLGAPYVWGAKGPDEFDCSGLMQAAWAHAGVPISAGTYGQKDDGRAVASLAEVQPGDLLLIPGSLGSPSNPGHVGMYAGHGVIVNAYDSSTGVIVERLDAWADQIVAIRRVAEPATPDYGEG